MSYGGRLPWPGRNREKMLLHGYRKNRKVHQELICSLGRLGVLKTGGGLDRLIASLARHTERCRVEAEAAGLICPGIRSPTLSLAPGPAEGDQPLKEFR